MVVVFHVFVPAVQIERVGDGVQRVKRVEDDGIRMRGFRGRRGPLLPFVIPAGVFIAGPGRVFVVYRPGRGWRRCAGTAGGRDNPQFGPCGGALLFPAFVAEQSAKKSEHA